MKNVNNKEKDSADLRDKATMLVTLVAAIILIAGFVWLNMDAANSTSETKATTVDDINKVEGTAEDRETKAENKVPGSKLDAVATLEAYETPTKAEATDSKN